MSPVKLEVNTAEQVNSPGSSLAEVALCMGVAELDPRAAGRCAPLAEVTGETFLTGVGFTAAVGVWTAVTLSVDTGTGCGDR